MTAAALGVIIPVFNGWAQTARCLDALRRNRTPMTVFVVDHGSTDATAAELAARHPDVVRVPASAELWWAGASNVGIEAALARGARAVLLLNNDCYLSPGAVDRLAEHATQRPEAVISALQVDSADGRELNLGYGSCVTLGFPTLRLPFASRTGQGGALVPTHLTLGGRAAWIPAGVLARVGHFAADVLPHYLADHDFYLRCRQAGVPQFVARDAVILVDASRTTSAERVYGAGWREFLASLRERRSHRNVSDLSAFFRRHYPIRRLYFVGLWLNLARHLARFAFAGRRGRGPESA